MYVPHGFMIHDAAPAEQAFVILPPCLTFTQVSYHSCYNLLKPQVVRASKRSAEESAKRSAEESAEESAKRSAEESANSIRAGKTFTCFLITGSIHYYRYLLQVPDIA